MSLSFPPQVVRNLEASVFFLVHECYILSHLQVLLVPSAFTTVTGQAHWEILLRARAIETQCYV